MKEKPFNKNIRGGEKMKKEKKSIKIRYLRLSEAKRAAEIYNSSLKFLVREEPISEEKMAELIKKSKERFFIGIFEDGKLAGHSLFSTKKGGEDALEIGIVIDPEYQGKGLGSLLVKRGIEIVAQKGYKKIIAEILEYNHSSLEFFKKNDFQVIGRSKRKIKKGGKEWDLIRCEYNLRREVKE